MQAENAPCGVILGLAPGDEEALLAHWLRLGSEDMRLRFMSQRSVEALRAHARDALAGGHVLGWLAGGEVRGAAEVFVSDGTAEAAFSVERDMRRRGIGRALFRAARRRAAAAGAGRLVVLTSPGARAMIELAASEGAEIAREDGEVVGTLPLAPGRPGAPVPAAPEAQGPLAAGIEAMAAAALHASALPAQAVRMVAAWAPRPGALLPGAPPAPAAIRLPVRRAGC